MRTLAAWLAVACLVHPAVGREQTPRVDDVVDAAVAYVAGYTRAFAFLLAGETSTQTVRVDTTGVARTRTLTGEMFLTHLAVERRWMAVHDVMAVDGVPIGDRDDLRSLLLSSSVQAVGARVATRNARYNLGRVSRNFNEPTLALQVFDGTRTDQFEFTARNVTVDADGTTLVTLGAREDERPTIVSSVRGGAVFAAGEFVVEVGSGRIRRMTLGFDDDPISAAITTVFAADPALDLWVPVRFTERYHLDDGDASETTTCESAYDHYRRFEATGRLLSGGG